METEKQSEAVKGDIVFASSCAIHNNHLVTEKLILVISEMLDHPVASKAEVYGIIFEANKPINKAGEPMFASFYPAVKSFVVNLGRHLEDALAYTMREDNLLRVDAVLWYSLLVTILHELKHASDLAGVDGDLELFNELPEDAQEWAYQALTAIAASGVDLEPPDMMDDPHYGPVMSATLESIMIGDEPWQRFQYELFNNEVMSDNGTEKCVTFREYLRSIDDQTTRVWSDIKSMETMINEQRVEEPVVEGDAADAAIGDLAQVATLAETIRIEPAEEAIELADVVPVPLKALPEPHTIVSEVETVLETPEAVVKTAPAIVTEEVPLVAAAGSSATVDTTPRQPDMAQEEDVAPVVAIAPGPVTPIVAGAPLVNHDAGLTVAPPTLSPEECGNVMIQVYARLYRNLFEKCGFQINADQGFTIPAGVLDAVYLGDIPGVEQLVHAYDSYDVMGVPSLHVPLVGEGAVADHHVKGSLNKDKSQPCYILHVNIGGKLHRRAMRPQDVNKRDGQGQLKAWARDARNGSQIMSIYKDLSPAEAAAGDSVFAAKIVGNPGQQPVLTVNPFDDVHKRDVLI